MYAIANVLSVGECILKFAAGVYAYVVLEGKVTLNRLQNRRRNKIIRNYLVGDSEYIWFKSNEAVEHVWSR